MKKILALIMALLMVFAIAACGKGETSGDTTADEVTAEDTVVMPDPVDMGNCKVEFLRAEKYVPFEGGESLLVHIRLTNNGTLETTASKEMYITAKCGETRVLEMAYQKEHSPEGCDNVEKSVAPGEAVELVYVLGFADGVVDVTLQSVHNTIPEKLEFSVDTKTLG